MSQHRYRDDPMIAAATAPTPTPATRTTTSNTTSRRELTAAEEAARIRARVRRALFGGFRTTDLGRR